MREALLWAQQNPVEWMRQCLKFEPWEVTLPDGRTLGQQSMVNSVRDNARTAVRSSHGIGKSKIAAALGLWFIETFPNSLVATTAPTFRQVKKIIWQEWAKSSAAADRAGVQLQGRQLKTEYIIAPGWFAFGFSADDPTSAQGLHAEHVLLILDEAAGLSAELYEALEGALTSAHTRLFQIGNPTDPTGQFAKEFKTPGTKSFAVSAWDTPNFVHFGITKQNVIDGTWEKKITGPLPMPWLITPAWVADKVKRWGVDSPAWKSRIDAQFPDLGDNTVISLAWLDKARQNEVEPKPTEAIELSVDVARFGGDEFVISKKHGYKFRVIEGVRGITVPDGASHVMVKQRETSAKVVKVDADGMGAGTYDLLVAAKMKGVKIVEMHGGAAAIEEPYENARAEWWWTLRQLFEAGLLDIDEFDDDLYGQLSSIRYRYNKRGHIVIESKDEMKARGLQSPDRGDSMAMAYGPSFSLKEAQTLINAMRKAEI